MLNSGLAASVLKWLVDAVPERLVAFVEILAGRRAGAIEGDASPLRVLIVKVNEALSMREAFPVAVSDASGDLTAGLKLLAQPLKLRLMRDAGDTSIGDYGGNVVLIEPLATMNAVHDFLWPKVCQRSSPPPPCLLPKPAGGTEPVWGAGGLTPLVRDRRLQARWVLCTTMLQRRTRGCMGTRKRRKRRKMRTRMT